MAVVAAGSGASVVVGAVSGSGAATAPGSAVVVASACAKVDVVVSADAGVTVLAVVVGVAAVVALAVVSVGAAAGVGGGVRGGSVVVAMVAWLAVVDTEEPPLVHALARLATTSVIAKVKVGIRWVVKASKVTTTGCRYDPNLIP